MFAVRWLIAVLMAFAPIRSSGPFLSQPQSNCYFLYLPLVMKTAPASASSLKGPATTARTSTNPCASPYVGGLIPLSAPTYRILPGASTVVQPGTASYGITANTGKAYRLVWTGANGTQRFYGSIWTTGTFTSFTPGCIGNACPVGSTGTISSPVNLNGGGQRIDFDTFPGSAQVGLDFVSSTEPVYFDLFVDGVRHPNFVYFPATDNSGQISNPGAIPFALTTQ